MNFLHRILNGVARRVSALPLRLLNPRLRADVLERACESMVSTVDIPGGNIRFFTPNSLLHSRADSVLTKETDTIAWINGFRQDDVFWDIGANVGVYSLYAAIHKQIRVLSFEPSAANYYVLTKNIQLNDVSDQVIAYCLAFCDKTRTGLLNVVSPTMGASLSQFGNRNDVSPYWEGSLKPAAHGMLGYTIDDFLIQFDPPFPTHLKLDVDGLELSILEGAQATLNDTRLRSVLVEVNLKESVEKDQALHILRDAGFHLKSRGELQGSQSEKAANHIFEKPVGAASQAIPQSQVVDVRT